MKINYLLTLVLSVALFLPCLCTLPSKFLYSEYKKHSFINISYDPLNFDEIRDMYYRDLDHYLSYITSLLLPLNKNQTIKDIKTIFKKALAQWVTINKCTIKEWCQSNVNMQEREKKLLANQYKILILETIEGYKSLSLLRKTKLKIKEKIVDKRLVKGIRAIICGITFLGIATVFGLVFYENFTFLKNEDYALQCSLALGIGLYGILGLIMACYSPIVIKARYQDLTKIIQKIRIKRGLCKALKELASEFC